MAVIHVTYIFLFFVIIVSLLFNVSILNEPGQLLIVEFPRLHKQHVWKCLEHLKSISFGKEKKNLRTVKINIYSIFL